MNDNTIFEFRKTAKEHNEKLSADRFTQTMKLSCNQNISTTKGEKIAEGVVKSSGIIFMGDNALARFNGG